MIFTKTKKKQETFHEQAIKTVLSTSVLKTFFFIELLMKKKPFENDWRNETSGLALLEELSSLTELKINQLKSFSAQWEKEEIFPSSDPFINYVES